MRYGFNRLSSRFLIFVVLLSLVACASDPVPTDLPVDHPANPDAAQAAYIPAINPFKDTASAHEMKSTEGSAKPHRKHMESHSQKIKPDHKGHAQPNETKTEQPSHSH